MKVVWRKAQDRVKVMRESPEVRKWWCGCLTCILGVIMANPDGSSVSLGTNIVLIEEDVVVVIAWVQQLAIGVEDLRLGP
jgi:hypothetical protein